MTQPDPLLVQLANRVRSFSAGTDISLNQIASLIGVQSSNFSAFVNGRAGLSAVSVCRLMGVLSSSKRQLEMKLEMKLNAKPINIRHFQSKGEPAQLDAGGIGGWVPTEDSTDDPNNVPGNDVTNTPKANGEPSGDAITDVLRQVDDYHRQAREAIAAWFANQKATVNRSGANRPARRIDDNAASRKSGPRPSRFN